jgi:hypothetical protein
MVWKEESKRGESGEGARSAKREVMEPFDVVRDAA